MIFCYENMHNIILFFQSLEIVYFSRIYVSLLYFLLNIIYETSIHTFSQ